MPPDSPLQDRQSDSASGTCLRCGPVATYVPDGAQAAACWNCGGEVAKRYRTIVADPPWPFRWQGGPGGRRANVTTLGYKTMSYDEITALPVLGLAADHATLYLWTTQDALHGGHAKRTAEMWGFYARVGEFIWRKPNFGTGAFPRIGHEICVIYRAGRGSIKADAPRDVHSVQAWAQTYATNGGKTHSAKPDGFYDAVERGHEGPYLELFARRARFGWEYWGDESLSTAQVVV